MRCIFCWNVIVTILTSTLSVQAMAAEADFSTKPASSFTREVLQRPIDASADDQRDDDFSSRGFLGTRADPLIRDASGEIVRDLSLFDWVTADQSGSINPSLRRNAMLLTRHGLFAVADGVYQVRGFDISNMTIIKGRTGYVLIDPLMNAETARAAMDLVYAHLGKRPVVAVIYSHSHPDHFGGVKGVVDAADVQAGRVAIIAPEHFMESVASEGVLAGPAMSRRVVYHAGRDLTPDPRGTLGIGVGLGLTKGAITLIPPTDTIRRTGETRMIDGVSLEFQMVPETEAPAEINVFLPDHKTLLISEMTSCSLHNIQTLRGARPRDALQWAKFLDEATLLYAPRSDVIAGSHCWPRFGHAEVLEFLSKQRDTYKFIHDQTIRLMNLGRTPKEIAEELKLPSDLAAEWYNRGYYGTTSHNSKAVYDRYLGWFNGVPADLNPLPPVEAASRYVALAGGEQQMLTAGRAAASRGDYRWAAELLQHLVFADAQNDEARAALADSYEQLGYQSESGLWRNFYLAGAHELRRGVAGHYAVTSPDVVAALPTSAYLDVLATRLTPERIGNRQLSINLEITDREEVASLLVENAVMTPRYGRLLPKASATISGPWPGILALFSSQDPLEAIAMQSEVSITGDDAAVQGLRAALTTFRSDFRIVTP